MYVYKNFQHNSLDRCFVYQFKCILLKFWSRSLLGRNVFISTVHRSFVSFDSSIRYSFDRLVDYDFTKVMMLLFIYL
jgi:hypothetical protein